MTEIREKRFKSIYDLFNIYELEPEHTKQVSRLALQLFDQLVSLHNLGEREREWLEAAALLHDIGWSQSDSGHHKESMKLIQNADFPFWADEEKQVIANIARYHRKAGPKSKHKHFVSLSVTYQQTVTKLAALLRIADALDRSHRNAVEQVYCRVNDKDVALDLKCRLDLGLELYALDKKKDLFRQTFQKDVLVVSIKNVWDM